MNRQMLGFWLLLVFHFLNTASAADQSLRVGVGAGCTHADLSGALSAIQGQSGTHVIRINKGNYAVADGMGYVPTVNQGGVYLEGGYNSCTAPEPTGNTGSDSDRAVFNGSGGLQRSVLDLALYGQVGTFQIRRIVLTGGDATTGGNDYTQSGGGLMVRGQASVVIGLGTTIRNNSAISGGGIALAGSYQNVVPSLRADLYIEAGAEILNNVASDRGGGIYCGGRNAVTGDFLGNHHGTIVMLDGTIGYNQANEGGAFYCRGTLEGGGGFQPRPLPGKVAWIIGNQSSGGVGCAAGFGTLDTSLTPAADGYRHVGAALGSNGLLAITANSGSKPALCLVGSRSRAAINDPAPVGQSRFRLRNFYLSDQSGGDFIGLETADRLELIIEPSGDNVSCTFFSATPCVRLYNNALSGVNSEAYLLFVTGQSMLQLRRAKIDDNSMRGSLAFVDDSDLFLLSSILDGNSVAPRTAAPSTSALFTARFGGSVDVRNSTVIMRSPLSEFFRLGWTPIPASNTGVVYAQASIFASSVGTPANVGYEGGIATTAFRRYWCGFFQSTSDFAGHTVINDPTTGSFEILAPSAFSLDANYAPLSTGLRDACTAPSGTLDRDFYGRPYSVVLEPASPVHADIGAVEAQPQDAIFSNGFES